MDEIQFIFQVESVDKEGLLDQVSAALEKRLEIRQQQVRPQKNMPDMSHMTEEQKQDYFKRQRKYKIFWGIVFIALGIYMVLANIQKPAAGVTQLVVGAFAIIMGIYYILFGGKQKKAKQFKDKTKFVNAAVEFLDEQVKHTAEKKVQIAFFEEEMVTINGELEELDQDAVAYGDMECALEGPDMFLLTYNNRGVLLQKKDLTMGSVEEFRAFLLRSVKNFARLEDDKEQVSEEETEETPKTEE